MDYPIRTLNQLRPVLQGFRKTAGLTQAAMANHLGVTQQTYAQLEANPAAASVERLFKVLRILQVELRLAQGDAAQSGASEATEPPAVARPPARRAARKAPIAPASGAPRTTPTARSLESAPKNPARTANAAKHPATPAPHEGRGKNGQNSREPSRVAAKSTADKKKREDW